MEMEQRSEIKFTISPDNEIELMAAPGVFIPTATTNILIQSVKDSISSPVNLLDLGCGTGIIGIALHLQGLIQMPLYASDLSDPAVQCSRDNFKRYGCSAEVRSGSLFEPWLDQKFDVIVDELILFDTSKLPDISIPFRVIIEDVAEFKKVCPLSLCAKAKSSIL